MQPMQVAGIPIFNYRGVKGTSTFWRFPLALPLQTYEQTVTYRLNQGHGIEFLIPAIGMNMRWAAHSCNGFSGGVDMDAFKGPGFESGYDPLWADLLKEHATYGLHALVGGGDQVSRLAAKTVQPGEVLKGRSAICARFVDLLRLYHSGTRITGLGHRNVASKEDEDASYR